MRGTLVRSSVPGSRITSCCGVCTGQTGKNLENRDNPQLTWLPTYYNYSLYVALGGSTLAKMWVCWFSSLEAGMLKVRATPTWEGAIVYQLAQSWEAFDAVYDYCWYNGTGLWQPSVHSDVAFWSFDVGSSYHTEAEFGKRWIVHPLDLIGISGFKTSKFIKVTIWNKKYCRFLLVGIVGSLKGVLEGLCRLVDTADQLQVLYGNTTWFGEG